MTDPGIRLDKWLWQARFFRSRSLAARLCAAGEVRVDGSVVEKAHYQVRVGQTLTFAQGRRVRVVRVLGLGVRRGPAAEARLLYKDLANSPPVPRIAGFSPLPRRTGVR